MTIATIVVRVLGLVRWGVQASEVGSVGIAEPYAAANVIPNLLFEVVAGGALAGAIVPLLAGPLVDRARERANLTISAMLTWTVTVLTALGGLVALLAPRIVDLIPRVGEGELSDLAAFFLTVFAVQLPLYGIGVVLTGALQAQRRFLWPALAPGFSSLVVIATYLRFGQLAGGAQATPGLVPDSAVQILAWGTTAGVAAMSLPLLIPCWGAGIRLRPQWRMPAGQVRLFFGLAGAGVASLVAQQISIGVTLVLVNDNGGPGAYPIWQYAQAVTMVIYGALAIPVATSSFPALSEQWSSGRRARFDDTASSSLQMMTVVCVGGAAAVAAAAGPIEAFFGFTAGGVAGMATAVRWLGIAIVPISLNFYLGRVLYAARAPRAGAAGTVTGWLVAAFLPIVAVRLVQSGNSDEAFAAVAASSAIGLALGTVVLLMSVRAKLGIAALRGFARVLVATALAGAGGYLLALLVTPTTHEMTVLTGATWTVAIGGGVGLACAGVGLWTARGALRAFLRPAPLREEP
ncbi:putative peptidoglycan lipid II flippase [Rarobacter faecitabidus]|uniref:Putative peptidoglycan lipid II flippase n=2 Tax=Rarobacter faecitabidus TaxID=13243 RepID=A0A542ZWF2_RARFA|nr:putative peptidoglycan lipid II flippase [Rarobacter faecitabidus]